MSDPAKPLHHDASYDANCIFCKIAAGEIPSRKVYEDDDTIAFHDHRPHAPIHFLVIPKRHVASLADVTAADEPMLGKLMALAPKLALEQGLAGGFKLAVNIGKDGGQEVYHLHLHVLGGHKAS